MTIKNGMSEMTMAIVISFLGSFAWSIFGLAISGDFFETVLTSRNNLEYLDGTMWPTKEMTDFDAYYLMFKNSGSDLLHNVQVNLRFKSRLKEEEYGHTCPRETTANVALVDSTGQRADTIFTYKVSIGALRPNESAWIWFASKAELNPLGAESVPTAQLKVDDNRTLDLTVKGQLVRTIDNNRPGVLEIADYLLEYWRTLILINVVWFVIVLLVGNYYSRRNLRGSNDS